MLLTVLKNLTIFTFGFALALKEQDVQFYCVRPGSEEFVRVFSSESQSYLHENFNLSLSWGFLIHGWTDSMFKDPRWMLNGRGWMQTILIDWAKNGNINACGVDWSSLAANPNYMVPALVNTHIAAESIATVILNLVEAGVRTENIAIAGHSLGAHIAGFTGKRLKDHGHWLAKIFGLDPAGLLFTYPMIVAPEKRLDDTDADFVQVIHTSAKPLGAQICLGDADFWANGGKFQPACKHYTQSRGLFGRLIGPIFCSHFQAVNYFWYALNPFNHFIGHNCANGCDRDIFNNVLKGSCSTIQTDQFGIYSNFNEGLFKMTTTDNDHYALP